MGWLDILFTDFFGFLPQTDIKCLGRRLDGQWIAALLSLKQALIILQRELGING